MTLEESELTRGEFGFIRRFRSINTIMLADHRTRPVLILICTFLFGPCTEGKEGPNEESKEECQYNPRNGTRT